MCLCLYVFVFECVFVCVYMFFLCENVSPKLNVCVRVLVSVRVCVWMYTVCLHVCVCMYTCICVCFCMCVCMCLGACEDQRWALDIFFHVLCFKAETPSDLRNYQFSYSS